MPDTASITTIKRFLYRGNQEEWSNTYHFTGTTPANDAAWKTLADALIAQEKTMFGIQQTFVRAYGYAPGNEHSVAQIDYVALGGALVIGTGTGISGNAAPGDAAFMIRGKVGTSSTGKSVYVRKYFHGAIVTSANSDNVSTEQKTAAAAFGAKLIDGTLPGSFKWCSPQGTVPAAVTALPFVTTRTLKRRGKRP